MDCMEGMKQYPDNFFDLAIVDPPYGDGGVRGNEKTEVDSAEHSTSTKSLRGGYWNRFGQRFDRYKHPLPAEECQETRRNVGLCELAERGRGNTQKNHNVGHCAGTRLF